MLPLMKKLEMVITRIDRKPIHFKDDCIKDDPSIKECLLKNAINFAEQHTEVSRKRQSKKLFFILYQLSETIIKNILIYTGTMD